MLMEYIPRYICPMAGCDGKHYPDWQAVMRHYIGKKHGILDKFVKETLSEVKLTFQEVLLWLLLLLLAFPLLWGLFCFMILLYIAYSYHILHLLMNPPFKPFVIQGLFQGLAAGLL